MQSLTHLKNYAALRNISAIQALCDSARKKGTRIVNLIRKFHNNKVAYICDDYHWLFHYLSAGYPVIGQFEKLEPLTDQLPIPWSTLQDDKIFTEGREIFGIHHGITLVRQHSTYTDFFCFGFTEKEPAIQNQLMDNYLSFEQFIDTFYEKGNQLITSITKEAFSLREFSLAKKTCTEAMNKRFYLGPAYNNEYLTRREITCLQELITGNAIPNIAKRLSISPRTVEKHVENVKKKLSCRSICQLGFKTAQIKNIFAEYLT